MAEMRQSKMKILFPVPFFALLLSGVAGTDAGSNDDTGRDLVGQGMERSDALALTRDTRFFISGRLRYEYGADGAREDSNALTWRNRLGFETGEMGKVSLLAELEHTWSLLGGEAYNPFPRAGRTVIADPENVELNRLQLAYKPGWHDLAMTVGRQEIALGDQRFIGTVGWRQNEQTLDAARLRFQPHRDLWIDYAYVWRVNRIFGEQAPTAALNHFESESHLVSLRYDGWGFGNVEVFGYLLDLQESPAFSSQTFGVRLAGDRGNESGAGLFYDVQAALQSDYGGNPSGYTAPYYHVEIGSEISEDLRIGLGYEVLGEDGGSAFQTPLGTNHKFNGYADAFLSTPASGLRDAYLWCGFTLPSALQTRLTVHHFRTEDSNQTLGNEIDVTLERKVGEHAAVLLKGAHLAGEGAQPDVTRASFEISYQF